MDPTSFDSLTKAFAGTTSRRRVLRGVAGGFVAGLLGRSGAVVAQPAPCPPGLEHCGEVCFDLMSDPRNCGRCLNGCGIGETCFQGRCTSAICTASQIDCWGSSVNPRTDPRNCGQCGEMCAAGQACVECACEQPDFLGGACRSQQLRLWVNAFLPGFIPGLTSTATVDGRERSVFQMETPTGEEIVLLADRDPDPRFTQTPFSPDLDAPGMAQLDLGMTLPGMVAFSPEVRSGSLVQLQETGEDTYVTLCERQIKTPLSTCARLVESDGTLLTFEVDCSWTVRPATSPDPNCPLDAQTFPPVRIQGHLEVERIDDSGLVEIRFTAKDDPERNVKVSQFPAFEMYARFDDGNQVAVFQREPDGGWTGGALVEVEDELSQQCGEEECQGVVARLGCGCGTSCINGQECFFDQGTSTQQCRWLSGYYVLTGGSAFEPANDIVCADPRCPADFACTDPCSESYLQADGPITVTVDGRTVYTSDAFGRQIVPPIGFRAAPGAKVRVFGPVTNRNRTALRYLSLHRVDGPFGMLESETRPDTGNQLVGSTDGQTGIEIEIRKPRSTRGSTVCCRDQGQQVCVDRMSSIEHCGGCNQPCADGMICLAGRCICPHPWVALGDLCVDPTQDSQHCGPKLTDCTLEGKFCAQSSCVSAECRDTSRFQVCDGQCVPLDDAEHCGFACESCRVPQNGEARCRDGVCDFDCFDGFQRCGFECVDPGKPEHCGSQCLICPPKLNATPTCDPVDGDFVCGYRCNDEYHDCNGDCFWNFANATCGSNCEPCPPEKPTCVEGECCWDGATICPGGCTDTLNDRTNCGGCGKFCDPGFCCGGGNCFSEAASCGPCGVFCGSGQRCVEGNCQDDGPGPAPDKTCDGCYISDNMGGCIPITCPPFEEGDGT